MKAHLSHEPQKLSEADILHFQRILGIQLRELRRSLDQLGDETENLDSDSPQDVADRCVSTLSKEALFQRRGERRVLSGLIEEALERIQKGTFGVCLSCGDIINPRRIDALPWTRHCLRCQQELEDQKNPDEVPGWRDSWKKAG